MRQLAPFSVVLLDLLQVVGPVFRDSSLDAVNAEVQASVSHFAVSIKVIDGQGNVAAFAYLGV
jgi:hypothetical protein